VSLYEVMVVFVFASWLAVGCVVRYRGLQSWSGLGGWD